MEVIKANMPQRPAGSTPTTNSSSSRATALCRNLETKPNKVLATRFSDGDRTAFTMKNPYFCADRESEFAMQPVRCVTGDAPTLAEVDGYFGANAASEWLVPLLADLSIYTSAKNLAPRQQKQLAKTIAVEYRELKVTELMLFFHRFKTGRYGRFYGAVDPMVVMCALQDFIKERNELRDSHRDEVAAAWDAEARRRWTLMADELTRQLPALKMGTDIYLFTTEPYQHRLLVSVATQEAEQAITEPTAWQTYQHIAEKHFPKDFGEVTLRRAFTPPVPYAAMAPQPHPQETAATSPQKPPDGNYTTRPAKT